MASQQKPPSQTWWTFLENHADCIVGVDFFTVPTATFRILYVFVVLSHDRRRVVHFNVTEHPTAQWTAQQLTEAFPFDTAPRYLLRDRDAIYGEKVQRRIRSLCIEEVAIAPRSPWQNPFCERVIGSFRRDCLDHVIVINERHLLRILREYIDYYYTCRTHLSLNKDPPETRTVESSEMGNVVAFPRIGGLHHRSQRIAACWSWHGMTGKMTRLYFQEGQVFWGITANLPLSCR
jgi:putative transposase